MKVERKYFRVRVDGILQNQDFVISEKFTVVEFQKNKVFLKNITAGGEK